LFQRAGAEEDAGGGGEFERHTTDKRDGALGTTRATRQRLRGRCW
jgi:hypothetical protein